MGRRLTAGETDFTGCPNSSLGSPFLYIDNYFKFTNSELKDKNLYDYEEILVLVALANEAQGSEAYSSFRLTASMVISSICFAPVE